MIDKRRSAWAGAAAVALAAVLMAPAAADDPDATIGFAAWDTNEDGSLSLAEFRAGMGYWGVFELWDTDRDGLLSDEEYRPEPPAHFSAAQAEAWDDSGEEAFDEAAMGARFYDAYDIDDDQSLAEAEFGRFTADATDRGWLE